MEKLTIQEIFTRTKSQIIKELKTMGQVGSNFNEAAICSDEGGDIPCDGEAIGYTQK